MRTINENKLWDLLKYINNFVIENNGKYPSLNNIMDYMSMAKSTAYRYILELQKRDIVSYNGKNTLRLNNSENLEIYFSKIERTSSLILILKQQLKMPRLMILFILILHMMFGKTKPVLHLMIKIRLAKMNKLD